MAYRSDIINDVTTEGRSVILGLAQQLCSTVSSPRGGCTHMLLCMSLVTILTTTESSGREGGVDRVSTHLPKSLGAYFKCSM